LGLRIYRWLIRLLPGWARGEYGEEMTRVVSEHWNVSRSSLGALGALRFWMRQYLALAVAARAFSERPTTGGGMGGFIEGLVRDLRQAARALRKRPGFTLISALTLGVGIGASTAVFSAVNAVLLRDLPFDDPSRIVVITQVDSRTGDPDNGTSAVNAQDLAASSTLLEHVAIADPYSFDLQVDGRAESLRAWWVGEGFMESLGTTPILGRPFTREEYRQGQSNVVLLGHESWSSRFGADPSMVGQTLALDGQDYTVVGVLPPRFGFPNHAELWIPRPVQSWDVNSRTSAYMTAVGRMAPGVTLAQAEQEVAQVARSIAEANPQTSANLGFRMVPIRDHLFGDVRTPLWVLGGAVGLVLLIACANVAGLLVARGVERGREFALRDALGASRGQRVRLMVFESALISAAGAALGTGLTYAGVAVIRSLGPDHLPRIDELAVDGPVLAFALGAAVLSALISGVLPAFRLSQPDPASELREGGRGASRSRGGVRFRNRLVVLEVAGAMVLLVGAGLLGKSFLVLLDQDLGFEPENRLALQTFAYGYQDGGLAQFVNQTIDNMEAIPGVTSVALTSSVPTANDGVLAALDIDMPFTVQDRPPPPAGQEPLAWVTWVSRGLFEVLGQPILRGRGFEATDDASAPLVIVINETLARQQFGDQDPIGETLVTGRGEAAVAREIIGVVADVRPNGHSSAPRPEMYYSLSQSGNASLTFVIRTEVPPAGVVEAARNAVWAANPAQAIWGVATLKSLVADRLMERRFNLILLGCFAFVSLFLAAIGIYGLVSYSVQMRRVELGIRRALGGPSSTILAMVLREGALLGVAGVTLGLVGSLAAGKFLRSMLFGVEPTDPGTLALLSVVVLGVSALAAFIPAIRAGRVDPADALRAE